MAKIGINNYEKQVMNDIQRLKEMSDELASVITELEDSKFTIKILHTDYRPRDKNGNKNNGNAFASSNNYVQKSKPNGVEYKVPGGGTVYYNPKNRYTNNDSEREPIIGLAHEFGHAYNSIKGKSIKYDREQVEKGDSKNIDLGNANEYFSIKLENVIRKLTSHTERSYEYYKKK